MASIILTALLSISILGLIVEISVNSYFSVSSFSITSSNEAPVLTIASIASATVEKALLGD
jgi:hypothetical protein